MNITILHKRSSTQNYLRVGVGFIAGLCIGMLISYFGASAEIKGLHSENSGLSQMVNMQQEQLVQQHQCQLTSELPRDPAPRSLNEPKLPTATSVSPSIPQIIPETVVATTTVAPPQGIAPARPVTSVKPPPKTVPELVKAPVKVLTKPLVAAPKVTQPQENAAPIARAPVSAPRARAPEISAPKIVHATFSQANIAGIDGASISFKTGLKVQIGGLFPSGEKLISVSPSDKKIVTDKRVIILTADAESVAK